MPKKAKKKQPQPPRLRRNGGTQSGPPPGAISYRGRLQRNNNLEMTEVMQFTNVVSMNTTSSASVGKFTQVFLADDVTAFSNWTTMATLWQEYRVLGLALHYVPRAQGSNMASTNPATTGVSQSQETYPLALVPFHDDATVLTSTAAAYQHDGCRLVPANMPMRVTVRMNDVEEAGFTDTTGGVSAVFGVKTYFQTGTVGTSDVVGWGHLFATYTVQFKGRVVSPTQVDVASRQYFSAPSENKEEKKEKDSTASWADIADEEELDALRALVEWKKSRKSQQSATPAAAAAAAASAR